MMELDRLLDGLTPREVIPSGVSLRGLTQDSRQVTPGDGYVALKGRSVDGHAFVDQACALGAGVILSEVPVVVPAGVTSVVIPRVREHLGRLAARCYPKRGTLRAVAVTGTNGKTSTVSFIQQSLMQLAKPSASLGTLGVVLRGENIAQGVLTTADVFSNHRWFRAFEDKDIRYVALEASSHALVQDRLAGLEIQTAIFTHLSRDHLDYHGTLEAYAQAKKRLFFFPSLRRAMVNAASSHSSLMIEGINPRVEIVHYGIGHPQSDSCLSILERTSTGTKVRLETPFGAADANLSIQADFMLENVLAAASYLVWEGVPVEAALATFETVALVPGRMACYRALHHPTVYVDYAHTPDALEKVLRSIRSTHPQAQVWCVFGCGGQRDVGKRSLMGAAVEKGADKLVLTNDNPRWEPPEQIISGILEGLKSPERVHIEPNREAAIAFAIEEADEADVVLVAGKGHENYQEVRGERRPASDAQTVCRALHIREIV